MQRDETASTESQGDAPGEGRGWRSRVVLGLLVLAPAFSLSIAAYVYLVTGPPHLLLEGDGALCELAVRELGFDAPWVGAYSRLGFHHPGPLHYYLLSPVYALFEHGGGFALSLSTAVLHAMLLGLAVWVVSTVSAARQNGLVAAAAMSGVGVTYVLMHTAECLAAWEPGISRVAILTTAAGAYATSMSRRLPGLLVTTFAASLAVQSHLSVVPPIAIASMIAVVGLWWKGSVWTTCGHPRLRGLTWSGVLALVLWVPPLAEQFTGDPGNLSLMVEALGGQQPTLTFAEMLQFAAVACTEWADRALGIEAVGFRVTLAVGQVLLAVAIAVLGVRLRRRELSVLGALAIGLHLAVFLATTRIVGEYSSHLVLFGSTAVWPLVAWAGAFAAGNRAVWMRALFGLFLVSVCAVGAWRTAGGALVAVAQPDALSTPGLVPGSQALAVTLRERGAEAVVVEVPVPGDDSLRIVAGLVLALRKAGFEASAGERFAWAFPRKPVLTAERVTRLRLGPHAEGAVPLTLDVGVRIVDP